MYFSGTNHPVGDVCWLEVSRQKGLLTSFSQPVFEPHANAGDGKDYILGVLGATKKNWKKKRGSSGMQKQYAGHLGKFGISRWPTQRRLRGTCAASGVILDHEGRLLFLSLSSATSECQRFPLKNTDMPRTHVMQNMPLIIVTAEKDWTICNINTWPPGPWTLGRARRHHLASPSIRIKPRWPSSKLRHDLFRHFVLANRCIAFKMDRKPAIHCSEKQTLFSISIIPNMYVLWKTTPCH